jgi:hypothetical protein
MLEARVAARLGCFWFYACKAVSLVGAVMPSYGIHPCPILRFLICQVHDSSGC